MKSDPVDDGIESAHWLLYSLGYGAGMALYRMDVLERPDERLRRRREFHALDDQAAVKRADELYAEFAAGVSLDRYVLYESDRVVHEHVEPR